MDKHIHKYLSSVYFVKTSKIGNDGIYAINDLNLYPYPVYGNKLIKELVLLFYLDEVTLKTSINTWAITQKPDVDLGFFWEQFEVLMPMAARVAAQTIGLDLVPVQPMSLPTGLLTFMDFNYSGDTPNRNGRVYHQEVVEINEERVRQSWAPILEGLAPACKTENIIKLMENQQIFASSRKKEE
jgi:hypothetical protein